MPIDLARLREQTIGSNVDEEAVTVNTRALIDKVLARYSGEWTTLRELIQNAADAAASKVVIRFETLPSKTIPLPHQADQAALLSHTVSHHTVHRLVISNDGQHFADTDWSRLKRIAEGNPDETKIGAFGVGFYSVFADCEEPFVISGRKTMAFIWKGNSLFTKASTISQDQQAQETCFMLNYRNATSPIPDLMSICQFLCTSLTFIGLQHIELWVDQWNILQLHKKAAPGAEAQMPSDINPKTKEGLMKVTGVTHQSIQLDAKWMNVIAKPKASINQGSASKQDDETPVLAVKSFFSKLAAHTIQNTAAKRAQREREAEAERQIALNLCATSQGTVFLQISTVNIQTSVSKTFAAELERATKKPPPKSTRIAILTTSFEETAASQSNFVGVASDKGDILFSSVLPTKHGRVFIGFPTAQTTGMLCHISAPSVIPTVERESIDLNARYVKTWNTEMLRVAGIACRIAYGGNMQDLKKRLNDNIKAAKKTSPTMEDINLLIPQASHIARQFCATESTPSSQVGKLIEDAFWECSKRATIEVFSTKGVLPSNQVRVVLEALTFLEDIPVIPSALAQSSEDFMRKLYDRGLIGDMTVVDVRKQLEAQSLSEKQMIEFLKYLVNQAANSMDVNTLQALISDAVGMVESDEAGNQKGQMVALSQVRTYVIASKIPPFMPVPPSTIPFKLTKSLSVKQLNLLGWEELHILPWLRFLVEAAGASDLPPEFDITHSLDFAASVINVFSKQWDHISQKDRSSIVELLSQRRIMPTKMGMRTPSEAYFTSVKVFDDLPTVTSEVNAKEKVLVALGVRKTIELNVVFQRLLSPAQQKDRDKSPQWSFADLIRYLVSVRDDIPARDVNRLREAEICPVVETGTHKARTGKLAAIRDLYEPLESLKDLKLPILYWPGEYNANSAEARFMKYLGLRSHPVAGDLVNIMSSAAKNDDLALYDAALKYFLVNSEQHRYVINQSSDLTNIPFLPVEGTPFPTLVTPRACFANERASVLGYRILKGNLKQHALKFGVQTDPPMKNCIDCIISNPPTSHRDAVAMFGYLGTRLGEITDNLVELAGSADIVPISQKSQKGIIKMASPRMCFLGDPSTYGEILDFVDFGQEANFFLLKVGSKQEPTTPELAHMIKDSPARILSVLGQDRYLDLLRRFAEHEKTLRLDAKLWKQLKSAPFLLAYKDTRATETGKLRDGMDAYEDDNFIQIVSLRPPTHIVVNDNYREFILFREYIHCAPPDDALESFYLSLGVPSFQSILLFDEKIGSLRRDQSTAAPLQKLIVERCRLFLHEYSKDVIRDAKWLEKNLQVVIADSLSLTTSVKGYRVPPFKESKTAIISHTKKECILFVTTRPDMYEISRCIIRLMLARPKQHDVLALEMVLTSDLRRLRNKGYNVERILRQQEHQAKIAEKERLKQQEEEERRAASKKEEERARGKAITSSQPPPYGSANDDHNDHKLAMPGAFEPDSPPRPPKENGGIFSQIGDWSKQLTASASQSATSSTPGPSQSATNHIREPQPAGDVVNSDKRIVANLQNAIQACRSHSSSSVFSPPTTSIVQEAEGSYCDTTTAQNLSEVGLTAGGIKLFIPNDIVTHKSELIKANQNGLDTFSFLLLDLASIFGVPGANLHIFLDPASQSIAFNLNGALFFNYHYFNKLHLPTYETSRDKTIDAIAYWWVTLCHELAHNLCKTHSAEHSFYTESFASQFFAKAMQKALQY
jgi:Protein of unknown function (DUF3684)